MGQHFQDRKAMLMGNSISLKAHHEIHRNIIFDSFFACCTIKLHTLGHWSQGI